jgi:hypothetical protein
VAIKVNEWLQGGADRVWEVRPQRRIVVVHRSGGQNILGDGETLRSDDAAFSVEGFDLAVSDIFK